MTINHCWTADDGRGILEKLSNRKFLLGTIKEPCHNAVMAVNLIETIKSGVSTWHARIRQYFFEEEQKDDDFVAFNHNFSHLQQEDCIQLP